MAKVLFTAVVADMRGKLAGTVFTKNRSGAVARTKVTPINRRTTAQQVQRSVFGGLASGWRTLGQAIQDGWNAGAINFPIKNAFGETRYLSGQQLYVRMNSNLAKTTGGYITSCPTPQGAAVNHAESIVATSVAGSLGLMLSVVTFEPNVVLYVRATNLMSPGVKNPSGRFKALNVNGIAGTDLDVKAAYKAVFGHIEPGARIFFELTPTNTDTGETGAPIIVSVLST